MAAAAASPPVPSAGPCASASSFSGRAGQQPPRLLHARGKLRPGEGRSALGKATAWTLHLMAFPNASSSRWEGPETALWGLKQQSPGRDDPQL